MLAHWLHQLDDLLAWSTKLVTALNTHTKVAALLNSGIYPVDATVSAIPILVECS